MSKGRITEDNPKRGSGVGLAVAVGLLWAAAIGVTWYFYRENETEGGLAAFFGRFHILMVHLPIGLLFFVPMMEMAGWTRWGDSARKAVPFVLWISVITSAAASFLGFLMMNAEDTAGRLMTLHMWTGLAVGLFAVLALVFKLARVGPLYVITLVGAIGSTAAAGHFGGAMVHSAEYLTEHAPERLKPAMEFGLRSSDLENPIAAVKEAIAVATGAEPVKDETVVEVMAEDSAVAIVEGDPADGGEIVISDDAGGEEVVAIPDQLVFNSFVLPILEGKCTECHSEEKIKGKLRLDTHEFIMAGAEGTDYPTVVAGNAEESELIARVLMPEDDDLFMPPEGKDKLTEAEIAVLEWWIEGGANAEGTVADLKADEGMLELLAVVSKGFESGEDVEIVLDEAAPEGIWPTLSDEERQQRLDTVFAAADEAGFSILPVSAEDDRLRVSAVNASASFGDEQVAALEPVAERILWLDLGRTQVTDAAMESIGGMRNLERLHLEQTAVTDGGAKYLAGLTKLEYLNLYGTEVTAAIFEPLANASSLRKLFLWETNVDQDAAREFQRQMSLEVNTGWEQAATDSAEQESPEPAKVADAAVEVAKPEEKAPVKKPEPAAKPVPAATPKPAPKPKPDPKATPKAAAPAAAAPKKEAASVKPAAKSGAKPAADEPKPAPVKSSPAPAPAEAPKPAPSAPAKPDAS